MGRIAEELAAGLEEYGGVIEYRANVKEILTEGAGDAVRAVGVRLNDGRIIRSVRDTAQGCCLPWHGSAGRG